MNSLISLFGLYALTFAAAVGASYLIFGAIHRSKRNGRALRPTGPIKLRGTSGMYRTTFVDSFEGKWVISAPLQRDAYVPLQEGESLFIEAPVMGGTAFFRTEIVERRALTHEFVIRVPDHVPIRQRRGDSRESYGGGKACTINGKEGKVLNRSTTGALVVSTYRPDHGDFVRIEMDGEELTGYALESEPAALGNKQGARTRVLLQS